jgi:hypothetical protein
MKTKDRCGKLACEARMSMKKSHLAAESGNLIENKDS